MFAVGMIPRCFLVMNMPGFNDIEMDLKNLFGLVFSLEDTSLFFINFVSDFFVFVKFIDFIVLDIFEVDIIGMIGVNIFGTFDKDMKELEVKIGEICIS